MNYKQAYKLLNENGTIDNIINVETENGNPLSIVKLEIINGIKYFINFINESCFTTTTYYWRDPEKLDQRITQKICYELAKKQIRKLDEELNRYTYMINALPEKIRKGE